MHSMLEMREAFWRDTCTYLTYLIFSKSTKHTWEIFMLPSNVVLKS